MKLIGSYTSPFVRKISVLLLEKGITFEFINELPYNADNNVARYNPLGKVPALVTDDGECWFDSPVIAQYLELLDIAPAMLPTEPVAALKVRQIEALADGIMEAALVSVREQARPAAQQSESELLRQREKINRSLDALEGYLSDGTLQTDALNLATIAIACAVGYLNFRHVSPGWCVERPNLVKLVETLFQRESFARTEPPKA
ncbi:TPA: glutathione S-transferase [Citrobacter freundii]